jgi:hypothetical protein
LEKVAGERIRRATQSKPAWSRAKEPEAAGSCDK